MSESRLKADWSRTSHLLCLLANVHRDPKKGRPFKPDDFNPFVRKVETAVVLDKSNFHLLKEAFKDLT